MTDTTQDLILRLQQLLKHDRSAFRKRLNEAIDQATRQSDLETILELVTALRGAVLRDLPSTIDSLNKALRRFVLVKGADLEAIRPLVTLMAENGDANTRYILKAAALKQKRVPAWWSHLREQLDERLQRFERVASAMQLSEPEAPVLRWMD